MSARVSTQVMGICLMLIGAVSLTSALFQRSHVEDTTVFIPLTNVDDVDWHPDGTILAVAASGVSVYTLDGQTYSRQDVGVTGAVSRVVWSHDGDSLAIAGSQVWLWDDRGAVELGREQPYRVYSNITWDASGQQLIGVSFGLTNDDNALWIWNTKSTELVGTIQGDDSVDYTSVTGDRGFFTVEHIADSDIYVTSSWGNNQNRFWDIVQRKPVTLTDVETNPTSIVKPSYLGRYVAIADSNSPMVRVVGLAEPNNLFVLQTTDTNLHLLAWNYTDDLLLGVNTTESTMTVWHVSEQQVSHIQTFINQEILDVDWHPEAAKVAIASTTQAVIWDINSDNLETRHSEHAYAVKWSPDGSRLAVVSRDGIRIYQ